MESGVLPWEASRPLLDLLSRSTYADAIHRPTNRVARWYWRLYQVGRPEGDEQGEYLDQIELMAYQLSGTDISGDLMEQYKRSLEGWLACKG